MPQYLSKFPARPPLDILQRIAERRRSLPDAEKDTLPRLTLLLNAAGPVTGWLLDVSPKDDAVLLHAPANLNRQADDVAYLPLSRIAAVIVHDSAMAAPLLSFGAVPRAPGGPAPSRLGLKRSYAALEGELHKDPEIALTVQVDWDSVPDGDDALHNLGDLLKAIPAAVRSVARDEEGRTALATLRTLELRHGDKPSPVLSRDARTITVALDLGRALPPSPENFLSEKLGSVL